MTLLRGSLEDVTMTRFTLEFRPAVDPVTTILACTREG